MARIAIIGGGLAGSEAALQLARHGIEVTLFEMRPHVMGAAHHSADLAELVCSNSLKSDDTHTAAGLLKRELEVLGSELIPMARARAIDAGSALAVDRKRFARMVTDAIESHDRITLERCEFIYSDNHGFDGLIIAAGPLASEGLIESLRGLVSDRLSFFDAAAPIIAADSVDYRIAFWGSRYGKGSGNDYANCPFNEEQYRAFHEALVAGERVVKRSFDRTDLFCACQPIEEIARGSLDALRFGALKPVGIAVPGEEGRAYAVAQLRCEDAHQQALGLVGFQTNLTWPEQRRIFRMIPGLHNAEFLRYGVMHRNTFIDTPRVCQRDFSHNENDHVWFAGQITGTEGYVEAIASGLYVARNVLARLRGDQPWILPSTTVSGALFNYATDPTTVAYQPMHVNFGLIHPLERSVRKKRQRYAAYAERALQEVSEYA